jgi:hypothetical protein
MTQLELPFYDGYTMPHRWRSRKAFEAYRERWDEGRPPFPHNHVAIGAFAAGRFILLATRFPPTVTEYVVGYYLKDMTWVRLSSFPTYAEARWYQRRWARLDRTTLRKAVWIHHHRPAVPPIWVPTEAELWDRLTEPTQLKVMELMQAGVPGRVSEVIIAGRECGLY